MIILSVRLVSVRPSDKREDCDKTEERFVQIFIPYERSFSVVFWEEEWLVGATSSTWNFGSNGPRWSEIADFQPLCARSASAVTPSQRSPINTNRNSATRFPMSQRWSSYVAPNSPRGSKTKNGRFSSKIALRLKEVCYKVSLCENCQRQSCKVFIGLTHSAKWLVEDVPFYLKFCVKLTVLERNRRFSICFRPYSALSLIHISEPTRPY